MSEPGNVDASSTREITSRVMERSGQPEVAGRGHFPHQTISGDSDRRGRETQSAHTGSLGPPVH